MTNIRELMSRSNPASALVRKGESTKLSLMSLQEEMNRLFNHFFSGTQVHLTDWDQRLSNAPAVNVVEDDASFKVEAELAGMDPKQVEVEITGDYLTLKGERKEEKEEKQDNGNYIRQEFSYGSFMRTIALPEADGNKTTASFKNGILTITVPKKAGAPQKSRKIEIKPAS